MSAIKAVATNIIATGDDLITVTNSLPHGHWLPWIEAGFGMAGATARRFIQVAERFASKSVSVTYLSGAPYGNDRFRTSPPSRIPIKRSPENPEFTSAGIASSRRKGPHFRADATSRQSGFGQWSAPRLSLAWAATRPERQSVAEGVTFHIDEH